MTHSLLHRHDGADGTIVTVAADPPVGGGADHVGRGLNYVFLQTGGVA
jgi:hypothetical protein